MWPAAALWREGPCATTRPALPTAGRKAFQQPRPQPGLASGPPPPSGWQGRASLGRIGPDLTEQVRPPWHVSVEKGQCRGAGGVMGRRVLPLRVSIREVCGAHAMPGSKRIF